MAVVRKTLTEPMENLGRKPNLTLLPAPQECANTPENIYVKALRGPISIHEFLKMWLDHMKQAHKRKGAQADASNSCRGSAFSKFINSKSFTSAQFVKGNNTRLLNYMLTHGPHFDFCSGIHGLFLEACANGKMDAVRTIAAHRPILASLNTFKGITAAVRNRDAQMASFLVRIAPHGWNIESLGRIIPKDIANRNIYGRSYE